MALEEYVKREGTNILIRNSVFDDWNEKNCWRAYDVPALVQRLEQLAEEIKEEARMPKHWPPRPGDVWTLDGKSWHYAHVGGLISWNEGKEVSVKDFQLAHKNWRDAVLSYREGDERR